MQWGMKEEPLPMQRHSQTLPLPPSSHGKRDIEIRRRPEPDHGLRQAMRPVQSLYLPPSGQTCGASRYALRKDQIRLSSRTAPADHRKPPARVPIGSCKAARKKTAWRRSSQATSQGGEQEVYFSSGSKQASTTCKWLSRAKFSTKSQAMGSCSRSSERTTTHLTPLMVVGMHQGE